MKDNLNSPVRWLKYLLYVGIAAMANSLLGLFLPGKLSTWIGYAISAATIYLLFRLISDNVRYKTAALFGAGGLICRLLGLQALTLAASICAIVAQYQEYNAHGGLIADRDPKLAGKWSSLFWLQFAVELIGGVLITMVVTVLAAAGGLDATAMLAMATVAIAFISLILKVLYLVYLNRTVKLLEEE